MSLKIAVLTNDGSPLGCTSKTLWGDNFRVGLGGSEYALLTMCEAWQARGDQVILYNDPWEVGASSFEQRPIAAYNPKEKCDALIIFRSPNVKSIVADGLKVWWSCDQITVGDFSEFAKQVGKIVCISPYHADYFAKTYGITNALVIDLPVRLNDFSLIQSQEKIPKRLIFTSVPARGLHHLARMWPAIAQNVPEISLVITSDYRLWGAGAGNEQFRVMWIGKSNVQYLGAIPRIRMLEELSKASVILYPGEYEELFCIAIAEAQAAGVYPITSSMGALGTTNMGTVINVDVNNPHNDALFVNAVTELLSDPEHLKWLQEMVMQKAKERFSVDTILSEWDDQVFKGI